jgi:coenzyme PQQ precursor peptide PqqA
MFTSMSVHVQPGAATDQTRPVPQLWAKPRFVELRLGFEVTLYSEYR